MKPAPFVAGVATGGVLMLGGMLTEIGPWYRSLRKADLNPPDWLFGPAWTTIGVLTATAAVKAWRGAHTRRQKVVVVTLFGANAALNVAWSALFFKRQRPDLALIELLGLLGSVAAMVGAFSRRAPQASALLLPYLAWVSFAGWLNREVVRLNGPFHGVTP